MPAKETEILSTEYISRPDEWNWTSETLCRSSGYSLVCNVVASMTQLQDSLRPT